MGQRTWSAVANRVCLLGLTALAACGGGAGANAGSGGGESSGDIGASGSAGGAGAPTTGSASGLAAGGSPASSGAPAASGSSPSSGNPSTTGGSSSSGDVGASGNGSTTGNASTGGSGATGASSTGAASTSGGSSSAGGASGSGSGHGSGASAGTPVDAGGIADASGGSPEASQGGPTPNKVLIYGVATAFDHASIPTAAMAIAQAAAAAGLSAVIQPANISTSNNTVPIPGDFTAQALAPYGAVVLLASSGEPLGSPGTTQIQALLDFVNAGGGLVAIEDANHAYDNGSPDPSPPFVSLIGGDFNGHSGYGPGTCQTVGMHPSNAMLPSSFAIVDEVYYYKQLGSDIQVVLECENPGASPRPISWVRTQGAGRVFYTGLGHDNHSWTMPPLVSQHILPALLWTMRR